MARRRKHWGWGYEDEQLSHAKLTAAAAGIAQHLGFGSTEIERPVPLERGALPSSALAAPGGALGALFSTEPHDRAFHAYGSSYRDVVRAFRGQWDHVPALVARPRDAAGIEAVLEWCSGAGAAAIPFGGGTSVVGGVEAAVGSRFNGAVAIDMGALDRVLEVDPVSRAARIQAGATGPRLEAQLAEHDLTLRFYPQSFQFATLGGWLATRAAGHFATQATHVDDLVESITAVTPVGRWQSRRLPGSGAGISPDRMLLGSEGTLGLITEAWVRVRPRPAHRSSATVRFATFEQAAAAARDIAQAELYPSNCRVIDSAEARATLAGDGSAALLLLGFEASDRPVDAWMDDALRRCAGHGGAWEEATGGSGSGAWRAAFLRAPYLRDTLVAMGVLAETFESAITWERLPAFCAAVVERVEEALRGVTGAGTVTCRLTHVYPDGAAPYFTVLAPAPRGEELAAWDTIKVAAGDAILAAGGTITHHHAVGRDHMRWYEMQRPRVFAAAMQGAKAAADPGGILNPGVLLN